MNVKQALLKAAELIEERGHCKGMNEDPATGAVCAYGAISLATEGGAEKMGDVGSVDYRATQAAKAEMVRTVGHDRVSEWNDAEERKPEEVTAMLRRAAENANA